jgi:hypothetical protein
MRNTIYYTTILLLFHLSDVVVPISYWISLSFSQDANEIFHSYLLTIVKDVRVLEIFGSSTLKPKSS